MADSIVRLKVESGEYENKIKRAAEGLRAMEQECRRVGGTFEIVEKEQLDFVKALGSMETKATTTKGKMRELSQAATDLTGVYRGLSQEEKNSPFGQALKGGIDKLIERAGEAKDAMADVAASISNAASDTRAFDQAAGAMTTMTSAFQVGQGAAKLLGVELGDNVEVLAKLQAAMAVTNGLQVIQTNLQKQSALMQGVHNTQKLAGAAAEGLETAAKSGNIVVTKAATMAQAAFNAVANMNPYVLLATAAVAATTAIVGYCAATKNSTEETKKAEQAAKALAAAQERANKVQGVLTESTANVVVKFKELQRQWLEVRGTALETSWIEKNKNAWGDVMGAIDSVNKANEVYINKAPLVIQALKDIAIATAAQDEYAKAYVEYQKWSKSTYTNRWIGATKNNIKLSEIHDAGLVEGVDYKVEQDEDTYLKTYTYMDSAIQKVNEYRKANSNAAIASRQMGESLKANMDLYEGIADDAADASLAAQSYLNSLIPIGKTGGSGGGLTSVNLSTDAFNADKMLMPYDEWKKEVEKRKKLMKELRGEVELALGKGSEGNSWADFSGMTDEMLQTNVAPRFTADIKYDKKQTEQIKKAGEETAEAWNKAASAVSSIGQALQGIQDPAAKVMGIIAEAVANVALGFANSLKDGKMTGGPWGWIAAAAAGTATMVSTIAAIKSATAEYHAQGGIVGQSGPFVPKGTDTIPAMLTPGEVVLSHAQTSNLANTLQGMGMGGMKLETEVSAEKLRILMRNNSRRRGHGEYVTTR